MNEEHSERIAVAIERMAAASEKQADASALANTASIVMLTKSNETQEYVRAANLAAKASHESITKSFAAKTAEQQTPGDEAAQWKARAETYRKRLEDLAAVADDDGTA